MNALLLFAALASADVAVVRRFALVVGSNDGGKDRVRLRYANTDAASFARVLSELGGVREDDAMLLRDATALTLRGAIAKMKQRIALQRTGDERLEFILYYSGHSNEEGLLLAGEKLDYAELRSIVADMPVDVKIAILDSCASGALVRLKGGQHRQAFLVDASAKARGHAFITSSSADEASQESDRIAGSFFTHFLVSGLRGAADMTGDKRVTLNEAYQFAFSETLQRTEKTQSGAQHANYDIQLQGSGDLVMTDVRSTRAGIVFDEPVDGRLFVRDAADRLVVEINKGKDRSVEIGLSAGDYAITREAGAALSVARLHVTEGQRIALDARAFIALEREKTVRRGDPVPEPEVKEVIEPPAKHDWPAPPPAPKAEAHPRVGFVLSLAGSAHTGRRKAILPSANFVLQIFHGRVWDLKGFALGFGVNHAVNDARGMILSLGANRAGSLTGLAAAIGANVADDDFAGIQAAVGANVAGDHGRGLQASVGVNSVKDVMTGAQVAVGVNYAGDWMRGVQISAGVNYAGALTGVQAGLVNATRGMRGFQVGLVNVASNVESGFQLGLINVAGSSKGGQLGLFSVTKDEPIRLQIYSSDMAPFHVGLRYGTKYFYGIALGGLQPFDGTTRGQYGLGIGAHIPFWHLFIDVETNVQHVVAAPVFFREPHFLLQQRLTLGGQILPRLAVIVGASFNATYSENLATNYRDVSWFPGFSVSSNWRIWPGFFAGLQI